LKVQLSGFASALAALAWNCFFFAALLKICSKKMPIAPLLSSGRRAGASGGGGGGGVLAGLYQWLMAALALWAPFGIGWQFG